MGGRGGREMGQMPVRAICRRRAVLEEVAGHGAVEEACDLQRAEIGLEEEKVTRITRQNTSCTLAVHNRRGIANSTWSSLSRSLSLSRWQMPHHAGRHEWSEPPSQPLVILIAN